MTETTSPNRLRDIKVSARDQLIIDPRQIHVEDGHNPRNYDLPENRAHLDELKRSIKVRGTLNPLLVRWDAATKRCILVDGECRLRANLELIAEGCDIQGVPTIQVSGNNEAERLVTALTANTGKPLSSWEIGTAFRKLVGWGWTEERISGEMGYTVTYVKQSIELADAPQEVKQMLSEQAVTPSLALQHVRENGSASVDTLKVKVDEARAKAPQNGKNGKPATAKRSVVVTVVRFKKEEVAAIKKALSAAEDRSAGFVDLCREALEIIKSKK